MNLKCKKISWWLCIFFLCSLLYGCNTKANNLKPVANFKDAFRDKQLSSETLTFCFPGQEPAGVKEVIQEIEKRLRPTLNIKLNLKWYPKDSYEAKMKSMINGSEAVDAFILSKREGSDKIQEFANEGNLQNLTPLFKNTAPNIYNKLTQDMISNITYSGKIVAVPQILPKLTKICAVLDDNKMKEYQVADVKDFNSLESCMDIVSHNDGAGSASIMLSNTPLELFAEANGYTYVRDNLVYKQDDPGMKLIPWEQTQAYKAAIEMIMRFKTKKLITAYTYSADRIMGLYTPDENSGGLINFMSYYGQVGIGSLLSIDDAYKQITLGGAGMDPKLRVYPLYPEKPSKQSGDITAIVLSKKAQDPERVLKFLNWIHASQENYDLFMYGIKDKNYAIKGDAVEFPGTMQRYFGWDGSYVFSNIQYMRSQVGEPFDFEAIYENTLASSSKPLFPASFQPDTSAIQALLEKRRKNSDAMQTKIMGTDIVQDKDISSFIELQKSIGLDKVLTVMQKQWDKYKSSAM